MRAWRYAWASPASAVGLVAALVGCCAGARSRRSSGVLEVAGGRLARFIERTPGARQFAAITLGHVVLATDEAMLVATRAHERAHVRQYERWGVLFFPAYVAASVVAWARGGSAYFDNVFEREARRVAANAAQGARA